jgi:hypothetical protein
LKDSFRAEVGPNFGVSTHTAYLIIFFICFRLRKGGVKDPILSRKSTTMY